jgi:hypothetical protein
MFAIGCCPAVCVFYNARIGFKPELQSEILRDHVNHRQLASDNSRREVFERLARFGNGQLGSQLNDRSFI